MKVNTLKINTKLSICIWSTVLLSVILVAFYEIYCLFDDGAINQYSAGNIVGIGVVVLGVTCWVIFYGVFPLLLRLEQEKVVLQAHADCDPLTNIYNRRAFSKAFEREITSKRRNQSGSSALVLMDIDDFKRVNDNCGHDVGDDVLRGVTKSIINRVRITDIFARFGGEEFILLLPNTDLVSAKFLCESIREKVTEESSHYSECDHAIHITISMGLIEISKNHSLDAHIRKADKALYSAKNSGKNKVVIA